MSELAPENKKSSRILIVDDDNSCIYMVSKMLKKQGYDVITAGDGEEGLEKAQATKPDLIVLDIMMPKMDGWTLIKKLRSSPEFMVIPVIFLTALHSSKEKLLGFKLGADDYLPKPFHFDELIFRVNNVLRRHTAGENNPAAPQSAMPKILVVDDDPSCIAIVSKIIKKHNEFEVITAADGEEGLAMAKANRPDLIILDVIMPKMDGWAMIKQLRSLPEFAMVPVIFLSSLNSVKERIWGFRLGADDYLPKPFHFDELYSRVNTALKRRNELKNNILDKITPQAHKSEAGISGTLDQIGLPSLLMLLEMEGKSGILGITAQPQEEKAIILINKGKIVYARIVNKPNIKNEEVVYYVLKWPDGKFDFRANQVDIEMEINSSITPLLLEAARRMDTDAALAGNAVLANG